MKIFSAFLFCLTLLPHAWAGMEDMPHTNHGKERENLVPTHATGLITPLREVSYCMDGATHRIRTKEGEIRLKGRTPEAAQELAHAAESKQQASISGYLVTGPECSYLSVYSVTLLVGVEPQPESK